MAKHNINKRFRTMSGVLTKNLTIVYIGGLNGLLVVNTKSKKKVKIPQSLSKAFACCPHKWTVSMSILCENQQGERYSKTVEVVPEYPVLQSSLVDQLNAIHRELMGSVRNDELINVAWLATTDGQSWHESDAMQLFEQLGGYNYEIENKIAFS